jgi:hypothetical protein
MRVILNEEDILFPFLLSFFLRKKTNAFFEIFGIKQEGLKRPGEGIVAEREI